VGLGKRKKMITIDYQNLGRDILVISMCALFTVLLYLVVEAIRSNKDEKVGSQKQ
jgi:hypothetical protein